MRTPPPPPNPLSIGLWHPDCIAIHPLAQQIPGAQLVLRLLRLRRRDRADAAEAHLALRGVGRGQGGGNAQPTLG